MSEAEEQIRYVRRGLNLFSGMVGSSARDKGFHQAFEDADWLEGLAARMESDRQWYGETTERMHDIAKRIRLLEVGMKMMLVVSELAEGVESLRDTGLDGHLNGEGNLGEELSDAVIRLGDLAYMVEVPLGDDTAQKMAVNKTRPYRHGRQA